MTVDDLRRNRNQLFWGLHTLGWSAYLITQYMRAVLYEMPPECIKFILIPFVLFAAWTTALAWRVVINTSYARFVEDWMAREPWYSVFSGALSSTYLVVCWSGLDFGIKYYETLQKQCEEALQASALAQEAKVKMLRYQLNPHFMFNTLNAISTLIRDGQVKVANEAIGRLSDFLRYTLDQDPMKKVTLRQELDALNLYLGIEQLRFGDRRCL